MKIAKAILVIAISILITSFFISSVSAGGWHKLGPTEGNAANTWAPDQGLWSDISGGLNSRVPHYGLSSSSNNCRTCHAVHNADNAGKSLGNGIDYNNDGDYLDVGENPPSTGNGQSFKLLRNESRATECYFCHGTSGALSNPVKKPYGPMLSGGVFVPPKGQHTLGAQIIPDSTVDYSFLGTVGLQCGTCHSVHGGWTLNDVITAGTLRTRILRKDPAQNGNGLTGEGAAGGVINVADQGPMWDDDGNPATPDVSRNKPVLGPTPIEQLDYEQTLAAFCGDCHNKNVNWDRGGSGSPGDIIGNPGVSEGERPNRYGHPLGDIDGMIDVYGRLTIVEPNPPDILTCSNCHSSRGNSPSKFPHQSQGHKLLANTFTTTSAALDSPNYRDPWDISSSPTTNDSYTGNPNRVLPNLDAMVCRGCHSNIGIPNNEFTF